MMSMGKDPNEVRDFTNHGELLADFDYASIEAEYKILQEKERAEFAHREQEEKEAETTQTEQSTPTQNTNTKENTNVVSDIVFDDEPTTKPKSSRPLPSDLEDDIDDLI